MIDRIKERVIALAKAGKCTKLSASELAGMAYGNASMHNPEVTREMAESAAEEEECAECGEETELVVIDELLSVCDACIDAAGGVENYTNNTWIGA